MLLILSAPEDIHAEYVRDILMQKGVSSSYLSFSDFPQITTGSYQFNNSEHQHSFRLADGTQLELSKIKAVWDRRPGNPKASSELNKHFRTYVEKEAKAFLENWFYLSEKQTYWLPSPKYEPKAESKPYQLKVAQELGFQIPETYIGNDLEQARPLLEKHDFVAVKKLASGVIYTPLSFKQRCLQKLDQLVANLQGKTTDKTSELLNAYSIPTHRIKTHRLLGKQAHQFAYCPVVVQEYVPKKLELRITVVGDTVFPCAIYSQEGSKEAQTDLRQDLLKLRHEAYTLPNDIEEKCLALVKALDLDFGCIDMIITPEDEYYFVEINPNGQWIWIEQKTGLKIGEAIADLLIQKGDL